MSVKFIDNESFYGYRVRRTVANKLYQEYFSLMVGGKRLGEKTFKGRAVKAQAEKRDAILLAVKERIKHDTKADRCFHKDGSIKGISLLYRKEKSGNVTPVFQVGIKSEVDNKVICTSFSIAKHGVIEAWSKSIESYCFHKKIRKNTVLYRKLIAAIPKVDESRVIKKIKPRKPRKPRKPKNKK